MNPAELVHTLIRGRADRTGSRPVRRRGTGVPGGGHAQRRTPQQVPAQLALANLWRLQGRYPQAQALLLATLELAERTVGPRASDVAEVCNVLGMTGKYTGRFDEAEAWYRRALYILGPDHPDVADVYNLGGLDHARRSLAIKEDVLGRDHPELAMTLNNLGLLRQERDERAEALRLFTRAVTSLEHLVEDDHPVLSACRAHRTALQGLPGTG
ncbi:MAG: tetratricopeptide repeat-containing protein [Actinobacteria bacterium]|nr:MAG: tetratricopeptide repeat-containing protein [Actinomycetota bacterium]